MNKPTPTPFPKEVAAPPDVSHASDGAATLAQFFVRADADDIETWVAALPASGVVSVLYDVTELRRALYEAEKMLRSRIVAEEILTVSETWTAPNGRGFMWAGDRERKVADPEGLRAALAALNLEGLAYRAFKAAFKTETKVYVSELDKIARWDARAEPIVRDFATWREGPPKLRALEEETGK